METKMTTVATYVFVIVISVTLCWTGPAVDAADLFAKGGSGEKVAVDGAGDPHADDDKQPVIKVNPTYQLLKSHVTTKAPRPSNVKGTRDQSNSTSGRQRAKQPDSANHPFPLTHNQNPLPFPLPLPGSPGVRPRPPPVKGILSIAPPLPPPTSRDRNQMANGRLTPKGEGGGGRGGGGGGRGGGNEGVPLLLRKISGIKDDDDDDDNDDGLGYLIFGTSFGDNRGQQQQQILSSSRFASNVPPLAMAEYLLLTGDFAGFNEALVDIVAIGMMSPREAEIYRQQVVIEYQSILRQESEAEVANLYRGFPEVMPSFPGTSGPSQFIPPSFASGFPDYGYYGNNPVNDLLFDRDPPGSTGSDDEEQTTEIGGGNPPDHLPPSDYIGQILQQMIDSIERGKSGDLHGPMKNTDVIKTPSVPSTVTPPPPQEQQPKVVPAAVKQNAWKSGKTGGKSGGGKGGGGGQRKEGAKGKGRKGGGGREKVPLPSPLSSSAAAASSSVDSETDAKSIMPDINKELEVIAKNKTKEANGTKTRRPLAKQQVQ